MSSTLSEQVAELEAERDELKRQVEAWEHAERHATGVPRVITADKLKAGMWVAAQIQSGQWITGTVHHTRGEAGFSLILPDKRFENFDADRPIVLLEDAPAEDTPKRLTVEDLDAAPVGSTLDCGIMTIFKHPEGWGARRLSAKRILNAPIIDWSRATLTYPEKPGYREFYDRIGAADLLHRTDPPQMPELPTEPGSVILVTGWKGEALDEPIYAAADRDGDFWATSGRAFPDECGYADPDEITGFRKAKVVIDE